MLRALSAAAAIIVVGCRRGLGRGPTPSIRKSIRSRSRARSVHTTWRPFNAASKSTSRSARTVTRWTTSPIATSAKRAVRSRSTWSATMRRGEMEPHVGRPEHGGTFVEVTDNPYVRAIAAGVTITDIDPNSGQPTDRPGRISDHFRRPFPNEIAARASNGGAAPPDLSVITSARHGGARYVRSLLMGYDGRGQGTLHHNPYFPGGRLAMAPPLADGIVPYSRSGNAADGRAIRDRRGDLPAMVRRSAHGATQAPRRRRARVLGRARWPSLSRLQASLARREPLSFKP